MDSNTLLIIIPVAFVVNLSVLYLVIAGATKSHKRALYEWAQLDLLAKIAKKQGVSDEDIHSTFRAAGLNRKD
jgi:hypothetical protein